MEDGNSEQNRMLQVILRSHQLGHSIPCPRKQLALSFVECDVQHLLAQISVRLPFYCNPTSLIRTSHCNIQPQPSRKWMYPSVGRTDGEYLECNQSIWTSSNQPGIADSQQLPSHLAALVAVLANTTLLKRKLLHMHCPSRGIMNGIATLSVVGAVAVMPTVVITQNAVVEKSFAPNLNDHGVEVDLRLQNKAPTPDDWKRSLNKIWRKLAARLDNQSSLSFTAKTYAYAVDSQTADAAAAISKALEPFNSLQSRGDYIATQIYHQMRCTDLWREATNITAEVKEVVDLLQDLLCSALSGFSVVDQSIIWPFLGFWVRVCVVTRWVLFESNVPSQNYFATLFSGLCMEDNDDINVWGLRPRPRRKPSPIIDARMQHTLEEHLEIYLRSIHDEQMDYFWTWFMDMWAKVYPQSFTASWEKGYVASYERLESRLDMMGGYDAKEELDRFYRLAAMESASDSDSSAPSEMATSHTASSTLPSDVLGADDGYDEHASDTTQRVQKQRAGWDLRRKAVSRVFAWHALVWVNGTDPTSEWERLDVDAWVEATEYDQLDAP
ncbi:uncharacterized protein EV420DRAFT_1479416 [Desarmillaria tabescens]|uniref:Uncharacterized protein n=1 Tax=Armillaria tabescens TaxID=1929756 RepID=A0AA39N650_ARMTA|nr:uncharacterized protein EV420DRAFT_1479416 [Desarmillaria tabescens]KAK0458720.1 hypothetical protein EV420DRAFT_1479416 [Desarmillaria tabescens]